nr:helix-turn-helix transcriptional regulator [Parablautia intestinalis]
MNVSRQTVSKWKSGSAYPEIDKVIELCHFFHVLWII